MTNEVQLIAWKAAIADTILYEGTCIVAQPFGEQMRVEIAPISGIVNSDLRGKWLLLTNELGQQQHFPIHTTQVYTGNWLLRPMVAGTLYETSEFDFSNFATYKIVTRKFEGALEESLTTNAGWYEITGDYSFLLGKTIQVSMSNGFEFVYPCTLASYNAILNKTQFYFSFELVAPNGLSGVWQFAYDYTPYNVELYVEESISQNWRFTDISNFGTTGSFSREFRIPATENNLQLFGIVSEVNFNDEQNYFHTKLRAEIRLNTFPLVVGHVRLMRTYTQNAKHVDLEISFYAETPDLTRNLGEKKLKQISSLQLLKHPIAFDVVTNTECVIASGGLLGSVGIGATTAQIPEQLSLNLFLGNTMRFTNGTDTATRVITGTNGSGTSVDIVSWNIGLNEDYTGGTWELIDNGILDVVRYALCDRGQNWDATGAANSRPIFDSNVPLYAGDMTPHVNAWWLFQNIISEAGFQLNPTPLETILQSYWCPFVNAPSIQVSNQDNQYLFRAQLTSTTYFDAGDYMNFPEIYDNNNDFFGIAYNVPFVAYYTFRVWLTFTPVNLYNGQQSISFVIASSAVGGTIYHTHSVFISAEEAIAQQPINVQFITPPIFIDPNTASAVYLITNTYYNNTPFYGAAVYDVYNASGWELVSITNPAYDAVVQLDANAPDIRQIDFVKDILNMHCCAVVPDTNKPNVLNIVPLVDYVNSGNTLDWTNKLDISKDITLLPTTDKQKRNLLFTYKNGGDRASKFFVDNGRTYGEYKIDGYTVNENDKVNDFANGELKIQLTAESNPAYYIAGTSLVVSKYINENKQFVAPNLRFVYMSDSGIVKMYNEKADEVQDANVLTTSHYSNSYADINDYDLNFSPEVALHVIESNPYRNLFNLYWRDYLNELYSPKARILEAFFALDILDVQSFSFADKVWIKDSYWRILEIQDYKVGMNESTKVVLLKTDFGSPDCTSVPTGDNNGQIEFVNFDGDPVPATATCCVRYGYTWNAQLGWCIGRGQSTNEPSDPTGGGSAMAMTSVMQGQRVQPVMKVAMVTGSNVSADNNWSTFVGRDITIPEGNKFTTAQGDYLKHASNNEASALLGSNTLSIIKGLHFGGGWRGQRGSSNEGSQQTGIVVLGNSFIYNSSGDYIEVAVGNETLTRISLEDYTQWSCILNAHVSDYGGFWVYSVWSFTIWKKAGNAFASQPVQIAIDDSLGGGQLQLKPLIDVTTDPTQHRFKLQLNDLAAFLFPTPAVNCVATINYTQSR